MKAIQFAPGTLDEMFELLKSKIEHMPNKDRECVLMCDEMAIQAKFEYDASLQQVLGYPTINLASSAAEDVKKDELATKILVFMLAGVATRWKQVIRYDYTGKSFNSKEVANIIQTLLKQSFDIGLNVSSLVMDMGPGNMGV